MSPRIKLRTAASPLLVAGALWGANALAPDDATAAQTPPPCSPDGVCIPNYATWGHYQTHWRVFPGDTKNGAPTPAEQEAAESEKQLEEQLGGPQLPPVGQEGEIRAPRDRRGQEEGGAPEGGILEALPGVDEGAEPAPEAEPQGGQPQDGAQPGPAGELPRTDSTNPLGPSTGPEEFGAKQAAPPAWLSHGASAKPQLNPLPEVFAPAVPAPSAPAEPINARTTPAVTDGPNLYGEDAPPALPASLQRLSHGAIQQPAAVWPDALNSLPPVVQPPSVRPTPNSRVKQTSVEQSTSVPQIVNPAVAHLAPLPPVGEEQQAIYVEASDQEPAKRILR